MTEPGYVPIFMIGTAGELRNASFRTGSWSCSNMQLSIWGRWWAD